MKKNFTPFFYSMVFLTFGNFSAAALKTNQPVRLWDLPIELIAKILHPFSENKQLLNLMLRSCKDGQQILHRFAPSSEVRCIKKEMIQMFKDYAKKKEVPSIILAAKNGSLFFLNQLIKKGQNPEWKDINGSTPLMWAAERGHLEVVQYLIEKSKVPIFTTNTLGFDASYYAVAYKQGNVIKYLFKFIRNPNKTYRREGYTLLMIAVKGKNLDMVNFLLKKGVDPDMADDNGITPLMYAVKHDLNDIVLSLINAGANLDLYNMKTTLLCWAARKGYANIVKVLLDKKQDPNLSTTTRRKTPLMLAISKGHKKIISQLLKAGAKVNLVDVFKKSALKYAMSNGDTNIILSLLHYATNHAMHVSDSSLVHWAAQKGDEKLMRLLLAKKENLYLTDDKGRIPLISAIASGNFNVAKILIDAQVSSGLQKSERIFGGQTPIMIAAKVGLISIVKLLLGKGVALNVKDDSGWTALIYAVHNRKLGIVKLLVNAGADINQKVGKKTPFIHALILGCYDIAQYFLDNGYSIDTQNSGGKTALMQSAKIDDIESVKFLIRKNANLNMFDNKGNTALMHAVNSYNDQIVKLLVDAGADIEMHGKHNTLAHWASAKGYKHIIESLVARKVNLDSLDDYSFTPLMYAIRSRKWMVFTSLIENGVDINKQNSDGDTSLMKAVTSRNGKKYVVHLIKVGAKKDLRNNKGETALIVAAQYEKTEIVQILIEAGVNLNMRDNNGRTALMYLVWNRYAEVVEAFIKARASLDLQDNKGRTALMHALRNGFSSKYIPLFIKARANLKLKNNKGNTALMKAIKKEDWDSVELIIGADKVGSIEWALNHSNEDMLALVEFYILKKAVKEKDVYTFKSFVLDGADPYNTPTHEKSIRKYARKFKFDGIEKFLHSYKGMSRKKRAKKNGCTIM